MLCESCGKEMGDALRCPYCGAQRPSRFRVMSEAENEAYQGVTIDVGENHHEGLWHRERRQRPSFWQRLFSLSGWKAQLLLAVGGLALIAFILLVVFPVALIGLAVGFIVWLLLSFFHR